MSNHEERKASLRGNHTTYNNANFILSQDSIDHFAQEVEKETQDERQKLQQMEKEKKDFAKKLKDLQDQEFRAKQN